MELIKSKILILTMHLLCNINTNAQYLGIGISTNHLCEGINLEYGKKINSKYHFESGLKFIVNTDKFNNNKQNHVFYQNGYANNNYERISVYARLSRKIIGYKKFELDIMSNILISYHSLLEKSAFFVADSTPTGTATYQRDILYTRPAICVELTIGPKIQFHINNTLKVKLISGVGAIYMNYSHEGISKITGLPFNSIGFRPPFEKRGAIEFVGYGTLPFLYFGIDYKIK